MDCIALVMVHIDFFVSHARVALGGRARRAGRPNVVRINNARKAIPFLRELASRTRRAMSPAAREATALLVGNWLRQPRIARGASNAGKKKKTPAAFQRIQRA